jgi:hypothetical protein
MSRGATRGAREKRRRCVGDVGVGEYAVSALRAYAVWAMCGYAVLCGMPATSSATHLFANLMHVFGKLSRK